MVAIENPRNYKVVVRQLPPNLTSDQFYQKLDKVVPGLSISNANKYFVPGKYSRNPYDLPTYSRAYLNFDDSHKLHYFLSTINNSIFVEKSKIKDDSHEEEEEEEEEEKEKGKEEEKEQFEEEEESDRAFRFSDDIQSCLIPQVQPSDWQEMTNCPSSNKDLFEEFKWVIPLEENDTLKKDPLFLKYSSQKDIDGFKCFESEQVKNQKERFFTKSVSNNNNKSNENSSIANNNGNEVASTKNIRNSLKGSAERKESDSVFIDTSSLDSSSSSTPSKSRSRPKRNNKKPKKGEKKESTATPEKKDQKPKKPKKEKAFKDKLDTTIPSGNSTPVRHDNNGGITILTNNNNETSICNDSITPSKPHRKPRSRGKKVENNEEKLKSKETGQEKPKAKPRGKRPPKKNTENEQNGDSNEKKDATKKPKPRPRKPKPKKEGQESAVNSSSSATTAPKFKGKPTILKRDPKQQSVTPNLVIK